MKKKPIHLSAAILAVLAVVAVRADASALTNVRAKMAELVKEADKIIEASTKDGMSEEVANKVKVMHDQIDGLKKTEAILEKQGDLAKHMAAVPEDEAHKLRLKNIGVEGKDADDLDGFRLTKFALAMARGGQGLDGIEKEMVEEGQKEAMQSGVQSSGFMLSQKALFAGTPRRTGFRGDLTAGGAGTGADLLFREPLRPIIDVLFEEMMLKQMGATVLTGLRGSVPFPVMGRSTPRPVELTENAASTELTPTTAVITLTPHRVAAHIEVSTQLLIQDGTSIEAWIRKYLAEELAQRWEAQAINGDAAGANMRGILQWAGIGSVAGGANGAAPTWAHIVALETAVANTNATATGYLTNTKVRGKLKTTIKNPAGTDSTYIWGDSLTSTLNGYKAGVSNNVPSTLTKGASGAVCSAIIFGKFSDDVLAQWGGLEFLANPYSLDTTGLVRLNAAMFVDHAILRAASFSSMQDALTA